MSAYKDALLIDAAASDQRLQLAAQRLDRCEGVVLLDGGLALRPLGNEIACEIIDPHPGERRCEEEYKVMLENAQRALERSRLGGLLPRRRLRWLVVEDHGTGTIELWPSP